MCAQVNWTCYSQQDGKCVLQGKGIMFLIEAYNVSSYLQSTESSLQFDGLIDLLHIPVTEFITYTETIIVSALQ